MIHILTLVSMFSLLAMTYIFAYLLDQSLAEAAAFTALGVLSKLVAHNIVGEHQNER